MPHYIIPPPEPKQTLRSKLLTAILVFVLADTTMAIVEIIVYWPR